MRGQPRINALIISGGCCHDYAYQSKIFVDTINKALPVDWTIAIQGGRGTTGKQQIVENPDWAKGFDIVVHNQCFADTTDEALIKRITSAQRGGPPPSSSTARCTRIAPRRRTPGGSSSA